MKTAPMLSDDWVALGTELGLGYEPAKHTLRGVRDGRPVSITRQLVPSARANVSLWCVEVALSPPLDLWERLGDRMVCGERAAHETIEAWMMAYESSEGLKLAKRARALLKGAAGKQLAALAQHHPFVVLSTSALCVYFDGQENLPELLSSETEALVTTARALDESRSNVVCHPEVVAAEAAVRRVATTLSLRRIGCPLGAVGQIAETSVTVAMVRGLKSNAWRLVIDAACEELDLDRIVFDVRPKQGGFLETVGIREASKVCDADIDEAVRACVDDYEATKARFGDAWSDLGAIARAGHVTIGEVFDVEDGPERSVVRLTLDEPTLDMAALVRSVVNISDALDCRRSSGPYR